jgi:hypothetical protein
MVRKLSDKRKEMVQELYSKIQEWKTRGLEAVQRGDVPAATKAANHVRRLLLKLYRFSQTGKFKEAKRDGE